METLTNYRNTVSRILYKTILKPIFFRNDPESVHDYMTKVGVKLGQSRLGQKITSALFNYENPMLAREISGIHFKNPVGLSAGFDKNAELLEILPLVGFGFVEVGSITGNPCEGNPKPRLWRLPESEGLVVYYGLKNDGCEIVSKRLEKIKNPGTYGVSVAMTNCQENIEIQNAVADYVKAFKTMEPFGEYLTVNISCPNALGGQPFIKPENLEILFNNLDLIETTKPIFIKLSPDMDKIQLDGLLEVLRRHRVHGIITTNLTKKKDNPKILDKDIPEVGGISGKAVQNLSDDALSYIYKKEGKRFILVGTGGIFTAEDAYKKIRLGASLVQMITGMIFEGPQVVSEINQGLVKLLKRDGFKNISEAVGVDNRS